MRSPLFSIAAGVNCLFSGSTGLALSVAPGAVSAWLGHPFPLALRIIGLGLLGFAAILAALAVRRRPLILPSVLVCAADFGWVLGTLALALLWPTAFSPTGWIAAGAVGAIVLTLGLVQYAGLVRLFRAPADAPPITQRICLDYRVATNARDLWPVVRDIEGIQRHAPNLAASRIVPGESADAPVRECEDRRGRCWREAVTFDDDRMRLDFVFDAARPGFPFPARQMTGAWRLTAAGDDALVRIWWDVVPKRPRSFSVAAPLLAALLSVQIGGVVHSMAGAARPDRRATRTPLRLLHAAALC